MHRYSSDLNSQMESSYGWDEEEGGGGWLLSYVDMLSVMLALMVVLLGNFAAQHMAAARPSATRTVEAVVTKIETAPAPAVPADTTQHTGSSDAVARLTATVEQRLAGWVQPVQHEHGVSLAIAEAILFESGRAELREEARPVLMQLAAALQEAGDARVDVEGHTDSRPIHTGRYESNWELAAARATAVTRFLIEQGLPSHRLRSVSYADTKPAADETDLVGYAHNRRVNLVVEFPSLSVGRMAGEGEEAANKVP